MERYCCSGLESMLWRCCSITRLVPWLDMFGVVDNALTVVIRGLKHGRRSKTYTYLPYSSSQSYSTICNCTPNLNPNTDYELIDFNNAANHFFVGHSTQHLTLNFYIPKELWTLPIIKSVDLINNQLMSKFNYLINCYLCSNCSC